MAKGYGGDLEFMGYVLNEKIPEEGPARKVANTVAAFIGSLVSIAAVALTLPIEIPDWGYLVIVGITTLGTALGVRTTKNGFSPSQVEKIETWMAEYIDKNHDLPADIEPAVVEGSGDSHRVNGGTPSTSETNPNIPRVPSWTESSNDLSRMVEQAREKWFNG